MRQLTTIACCRYSSGMKTTIDIDEKLLAKAKRRALENGTTLEWVVESALRQSLSRVDAAPGFRLRWKTVKGQLKSGADIADRDLLYERMEGRW